MDFRRGAVRREGAHRSTSKASPIWGVERESLARFWGARVSEGFDAVRQLFVRGFFGGRGTRAAALGDLLAAARLRTTFFVSGLGWRAARRRGAGFAASALALAAGAPAAGAAAASEASFALPRG